MATRESPACCGACAHLAAGGEPRPATPPLRFALEPDGAPRGAWLVLPTGAVALTRPVTVVGRAKGCDVVIDDPTLSRRTCSIGFDADGHCVVADLQSACGVIVGDRRIDRVALHEGDRVYVGGTSFSVVKRPA